MEQDRQKQRRKNLLVGWSIGIFAVILYVFTIFYS
jgi:hypothetical protein